MNNKEIRVNSKDDVQNKEIRKYSNKGKSF